MGTLSRNDMEQAIVQKGSVLYQGRIISRIQDLPTDADLAKGNPEQEAAAAAALDAQIAALQAQRARLNSGQSPQISPAPGDRAADRAQHGQVAAGAGHESTEHVFHPIVGRELTDRLSAAGYSSPYAVDRATDEQLLAVEGMKPVTLKKLRAATAGAGRE